jgi:hypothetical protein
MSADLLETRGRHLFNRNIPRQEMHTPFILQTQVTAMGKWIWLNFLLWSGACALNSSFIFSKSSHGRRRNLLGSDIDSVEKSKSKYFKSFRKIYGGSKDAMPACLSYQKENGWVASKGEALTADGSNLPLYVIAVGPEASGHQMWKILLENSIFDCIWVRTSPSPSLSSAQSYLLSSHCLLRLSQLLALI